MGDFSGKILIQFIYLFIFIYFLHNHNYNTDIQCFPLFIVWTGLLSLSVVVTHSWSAAENKRLYLVRHGTRLPAASGQYLKSAKDCIGVYTSCEN
jgi:hypothetical protein